VLHATVLRNMNMFIKKQSDFSTSAVLFLAKSCYTVMCAGALS